jgi:hypothetical protein
MYSQLATCKSHILQHAQPFKRQEDLYKYTFPLSTLMRRNLQVIFILDDNGK